MRRVIGLGAFIALVLSGCGGGGGGSLPTAGNPAPTNPGAVSYTPGVYPPASTLAAQCANPRSGLNPDTGRRWPDRQGSTASENSFLRSWTNDTYLWYSEVPDRDPNGSTNVLEFFDVLKTGQLTATGRPKDRFHFYYDTDEWIALSQSGVLVGYGAEWVFVSTAIPRKVVIAYTEAGSAAAIGGLTRGMEVLRVDDFDSVNGSAQAFNQALSILFPAEPSERHTFTLRTLTGETITAELQSSEVQMTPVPVVKTLQTSTGLVGYILFHDHNAPSEAQLADGIALLQTQGVQDLVLDVRYNGGGYLDIASSLAYMIAGAETSGRTFERLQFNDKHPTTNPVTQQPLTPTPFHTAGNFGSADGRPLPTLNRPRVYVLTGPNTCSASESIINSLSGIGVEVYQIGSTTCGKPFGFYAQENCGTTYFSIQFRGVNHAGFGGYEDGFSPASVAQQNGAMLPGCSVADDFTRPLGDPAEARLAAALAFRAGNHQTSACPTATGLAPGAQGKAGVTLSATDGLMRKSPARENRILREM